MIAIVETRGTLPFAVKRNRDTWRYFATFAEADHYRQRVMAAEARGASVCNGCLKEFRWMGQLNRHQVECIGEAE